MSLITQITQSELFINSIIQQLPSKIIDQQATVNTTDGRTEGTITDCNVGTDLKFDIAEGDALSWQIPFSVTCDATIGYKTSDGKYGDETNPDKVCGFVDVTFPPDTLNSEEIDEIVEGCEIDITLESADFDSEDTFEIP